MDILGYCTQFKKLKRAYNKDLGKAPHKPVLLLAVLQLIRSGHITSNRIYITPELVMAFRATWDRLVETKHTRNFALPFFHLRNESFWQLHYTNPSGALIKSIATLNVLKSWVLYAEVDLALFNYMVDPIKNQYLTEELQRFYFPDQTGVDAAVLAYREAEMIKNEILREPAAVYQERMLALELTLSQASMEEERFIRGGIFKREIPRIYDNQCCISGMRIDTTIQAQMVDACHIKPFSVSNDDTLSNGICLSPTLHRAFDRGLLTVTDDYKVRISNAIVESDSVFSLRQFEGKPILLPRQHKDYPSQVNFDWHRRERFVG